MAAAPQQNIVGIVREYGKRLFGFIRQRVPTDADAEDVLPDVWYQFSRVADAEPIEQISGWLFQVARNRVTDLRRKKTPDAVTMFNSQPNNGKTRRHPWKYLFFPLIATGVVLLLGMAVQYLWNAILPAAIGVGTLTFWHAVGLLVLCRLLFGGFGGRGGGGWGGHRRGGPPARMRERWMKMSEEERIRFREEWKQRCRPRGRDGACK